MNQDQSQNISMAQIMAFAASPAGRQLIAMLQNKGGNELHAAKDLAASGNMEQAKQTLSELLKDPQVRSLLEQFGG